VARAEELVCDAVGGLVVVAVVHVKVFDGER
jgi:hypothetical protein